LTESKYIITKNYITKIYESVGADHFLNKANSTKYAAAPTITTLKTKKKSIKNRSNFQ